MGEVYDPPVNYKVTVYKKNLKIREGYRLDSQEVGILKPGEVVVADQRKDRRLRITFPIKGWVSWQNKQGYIVMKQEVTNFNVMHFMTIFKKNFYSLFLFEKINSNKIIYGDSHAIATF